jgi:hypothetical protein
LTILRILALGTCAICAAPANAADILDLPVPAEVATVNPWAVWAEASVLIMSRQNGDEFPVVSTAGAPGSGDIFRADDFEPGDWELGAEAALGFGNGVWGLEVRGFWLGEFEESQTFVSGGGGVLIETDPATGYGLPPGGSMTGTFQSRIFGAEASASYQLFPSTTAYAGPRWIQLDEHFDLFGDFGGANERNVWDVDNQLLGGQIGLRTDWIAMMGGSPDGFSLATDVSLGLFNNRTELDFETLDSGVSRYGVISDSESNVALALDAGLDVGYRFTPGFEVFAGYNVLWINGIATAVEQVNATGSFGGPPPADIDSDGTAIYHGGKAGIRVRF